MIRSTLAIACKPAFFPFPILFAPLRLRVFALNRRHTNEDAKAQRKNTN